MEAPSRLSDPAVVTGNVASEKPRGCIVVTARRRNVEAIDRISLASRREAILARKAKANLSGFKGNQYSGPLLILAKDQIPVHTRVESAKAADVGERTYDAGKLILKAVARFCCGKFTTTNQRASDAPVVANLPPLARAAEGSGKVTGTFGW